LSKTVLAKSGKKAFVGKRKKTKPNSRKKRASLGLKNGKSGECFLISSTTTCRGEPDATEMKRWLV